MFMCVCECSVCVVNVCVYVYAGFYEGRYVHVCMYVVYVCGAHMCIQICMRDHVSVYSMCVVYVCGACMCMQVCVRGYMLCMHVCSILCGSHICMQVYVRDHMSMCTLWRGQRLMSSILLF